MPLLNVVISGVIDCGEMEEMGVVPFSTSNYTFISNKRQNYQNYVRKTKTKQYRLPYPLTRVCSYDRALGRCIPLILNNINFTCTILSDIMPY